MDSNIEKKSYSPASTVKKALRILEVLGENQASSPVELSTRLKLTLSNVHRLLATLAQMGYVEKGPDSRFRLGLKVFALGSSVSLRNMLADAAYPHMVQLAEICQENVNLGIIFEEKVLYIEKIESNQILRLDQPVGRTDPLYCTGLGKVLLAGLSESELDTYMKAVDLLPLTKSTITEPDKLKLHIRKIRQQGFATDFGELSEGIHCLAVPIHNHTGKITAAISICAPSIRMPRKKMHSFKGAIIAASDRITQRIRFRELESGF